MTIYTRLVIFILALLGMAGIAVAQQTEAVIVCDYLTYEVNEVSGDGLKVVNEQTIGYMNDRAATPVKIAMQGQMTWEDYYYTMFLTARGGNKKQCVTKDAFVVFTFTDSTTLRLNHSLNKYCEDERLFSLPFLRPGKPLANQTEQEQENEDVISYFGYRTVYSIDLHFNKSYSEVITLTDPKIINKQMDCIYFYED